MPGTPDFSKIWAQNSPLDPYVITDGNYLEGLNFIGSQPPDRGIFDAWMNNADQKMKYLYDNSASSESLTEHNDNPSAHSKLTLTMNDLLTPTKDTDTLVNLLSGLGKRFRDVTGKGNWYDAPDISLATLATLVSNLASGSDVSWSGSKFTNSKLGISGLMAQNGYIQFGPNFGGLIVQWGLLNDDTTRKFNFPVTINATKTVVSIDTFYGTSQLSEITSTYVTWICYRNSLDAPTSAKLSVRIIAISC